MTTLDFADDIRLTQAELLESWEIEGILFDLAFVRRISDGTRGAFRFATEVSDDGPETFYSGYVEA